MAEDDDLRINTLHRFEKHSPRLVLREYSHCEVPAGCGGVVLRWIDPRAGLPVVVRITSAVAVDTWLDGAPLTGDRASVTTGAHLLGLRTKSTERVLLAIAIRPDAPGDRRDLLGGRPLVRVTEAEPGEGWSATDFDDARFSPASVATDEELGGAPDWAQWGFRRVAAEGGCVFSVPGAAWLRVRFDVREGEWRVP